MKREPDDLGVVERALVTAATWWMPYDRRREVTGDLIEGYRARRIAAPHRSHRGWFVREIVAHAAWTALAAAHNAVSGFRRQWGGNIMRGFAQDLRYGIRSFIRTPGFTVVTVATLALGVGATTAIFTVVNAVVWSPLGFPESERVVGVCQRSGDEPPDFCGISPPNMGDLSRASSTLDGFGLARSTPLLWDGGDGMEVINAGIGTPGFLTTLGARPLLGRLLEQGDLPPDGGRVVVLSYRYWVTQFGADSSIVGRILTYDDQPYEVVGVLDAATDLPLLGWVSLWAPLPWSPADETNRGWRGFRSIARLRPGTTMADARAELTTLAAGLATAFPAVNGGHRFEVVRLRDYLVAPVRPQLLVFFGASVLVLAIACVNVANLLLTRASSRQKEYAVRASLGARGGRLIQQMLAESLILCFLGGTVGLWIGQVAVGVFVSLAPPAIPRIADITIDGGVFGVAFVMLAGTTLLFGLVPAVLTRHLDLAGAIRQGGQWRTSGGKVGTRNAFVVAEVALAVMLLTGAGLLIRSFAASADWDPGFPTENLAVMWLLASANKYEDTGESVRAFELASENVAALPAVTSVGMASAGPLFGGYEPGEFTVAGRPDPGPGRRARLRWIDVDANYFATVGLPLLAGRVFRASDNDGTPPVAIVNEEAARRLFQDMDPIGQRVVDADMAGRAMEIVGVVQNIEPFDPHGTPEPVVYWPNRQRPRLATYLVVRTSGDAARTFEAVEDRIHEVDPTMSVGRPTTLDALMSDRLVRPRFQMLLVGIFAAIALALASVGTYGVISYTVTGRTHEFGLRISLGADRRTILRLVLGQGLRLGTVGLVLGWVGAFGLTQLMGTILVGVTPRDPLTFGAVGLALVGVVLVATYMPARRAAGIDPTEAMRAE